MSIIFNIEQSAQNSAFNVLQEPIKMILTNEVEAFEKSSIVSKVYNMKTTDKFQEEFRTKTAMDGFEPTEDLEIAGLTDFEESYSKQYRTQIWTNSYVISKQTIEDKNDQQITPDAIGFIQTYGRTREQYAVSMFGAALGNTITFGRRNKIVLNGTGADTVDGSLEGAKQVYFHNAHKGVALQNGGSLVTQSNKFHAAVDMSGADMGMETKILDILAQVETKMNTYLDDKGNIIPCYPTTILVPTNYRLLNTLKRALKSAYGERMGSNGVNTEYGKWTIVESPYLSAIAGFTDADYGMVVIDPVRNRVGMGATWYDRVPLTVRSYIDNATEANVWAGRARFGAGFGDFRAMAYVSFAATAPVNSTELTPIDTPVYKTQEA